MHQGRCCTRWPRPPPTWWRWPGRPPPGPEPPDCTSPSCTDRRGCCGLLVQDEAAGSMPPATDPLGLGARSWDELAAITSVVRGAAHRCRARPWVGHVAAELDFPSMAVLPSRPVETSPLTAREGQVLSLLAAGLTDQPGRRSPSARRHPAEPHSADGTGARSHAVATGQTPHGTTITVDQHESPPSHRRQGRRSGVPNARRGPPTTPSASFARWVSRSRPVVAGDAVDTVVARDQVDAVDRVAPATADLLDDVVDDLALLDGRGRRPGRSARTPRPGDARVTSKRVRLPHCRQRQRVRLARRRGCIAMAAA